MPFGLEINYIAVLVVSIIGFAFGSLWYGLLFAKAWEKASGIKKQNSKKENRFIQMVIVFIITLVVVYVLSIFVKLANASTIFEGATIGFLVWLGFSIPTTIGSIMWEKKSINLFYIDGLYNLLIFIIMSSILAVWA
jgi:heme/copper-type cytochrome/quinol oxidase subunit 2